MYICAYIYVYIQEQREIDALSSPDHAAAERGGKLGVGGDADVEGADTEKRGARGGWVENESGGGGDGVESRSIDRGQVEKLRYFCKALLPTAANALISVVVRYCTISHLRRLQHLAREPRAEAGTGGENGKAGRDASADISADVSVDICAGWRLWLVVLGGGSLDLHSAIFSNSSPRDLLLVVEDTLCTIIQQTMHPDEEDAPDVQANTAESGPSEQAVDAQRQTLMEALVRDLLWVLETFTLVSCDAFAGVKELAASFLALVLAGNGLEAHEHRTLVGLFVAHEGVRTFWSLLKLSPSSARIQVLGLRALIRLAILSRDKQDTQEAICRAMRECSEGIVLHTLERIKACNGTSAVYSIGEETAVLCRALQLLRKIAPPLEVCEYLCRPVSGKSAIKSSPGVDARAWYMQLLGAVRAHAGDVNVQLAACALFCDVMPHLHSVAARMIDGGEGDDVWAEWGRSGSGGEEERASVGLMMVMDLALRALDAHAHESDMQALGMRLLCVILETDSSDDTYFALIDASPTSGSELLVRSLRQHPAAGRTVQQCLLASVMMCECNEDAVQVLLSHGLLAALTRILDKTDHVNSLLDKSEDQDVTAAEEADATEDLEQTEDAVVGEECEEGEDAEEADVLSAILGDQGSCADEWTEGCSESQVLEVASDLLLHITDHICELMPEHESPTVNEEIPSGVAEQGRSVMELAVRVMSRASSLHHSSCTACVCQVIADLLPLSEEAELFHRSIGICIPASPASAHKKHPNTGNTGNMSCPTTGFPVQSNKGLATNGAATSCAAHVCEALKVWKACLRDSDQHALADTPGADTDTSRRAPPHDQQQGPGRTGAEEALVAICSLLLDIISKSASRALGVGVEFMDQWNLVYELLDLLIVLRHDHAPAFSPAAVATLNGERGESEGGGGERGDGGGRGWIMSTKGRQIQECVMQALFLLFRSGSTSRQAALEAGALEGMIATMLDDVQSSRQGGKGGGTNVRRAVTRWAGECKLISDLLRGGDLDSDRLSHSSHFSLSSSISFRSQAASAEEKQVGQQAVRAGMVQLVALLLHNCLFQGSEGGAAGGKEGPSACGGAEKAENVGGGAVGRAEAWDMDRLQFVLLLFKMLQRLLLLCPSETVEAMAASKAVKLIEHFTSLNDSLGTGEGDGDSEGSHALAKALVRVSRLAHKCLAFHDNYVMGC
jgi:hypothetical protein